jgi:diguanylate cyclase (GGDEF)-like protein
MTRRARLLFFVAFVLVVGGAAWTQYTAQRTQADATAAASRATTELLESVIGVENAARDYAVTRDAAVLDSYRAGLVRVHQARTNARTAIGDTAELRAGLDEELVLIDTWAGTTARDVAATTSAPSAAAAAIARDPLVARIRAADDALARAIDRHGRDARDQAGLRGFAVLIGLCAGFGLLNWVLFVRTERRETDDRDRQTRFAEHLQTARTEDEARGILARHLESVVPGAIVIVTGDAERSLAGRPIMAGGERIGTVIIRSARDLRPRTERRVHDSVLRAAPVLGTLRMLTVAETRAATDALTGLGNRWLVEDALTRLAAQSRRNGAGFAVAMIDVDRFKDVNDTFGHEVGDELLVAIAGALTSETREYDIVGRRGGDEFIVILAGIEAAHATATIDRCRGAIARLRCGNPPRGASASFGVAISAPGEPGDPAVLVRAADEAVYEAKARGGNCVVSIEVPADPLAQASALRA